MSSGASQCAGAHEDVAKSRQPLLVAALKLFGSAARVAGSPLLAAKEQIDQLLHFLWLQFAVLYTGPKAPLSTSAATAYLDVRYPFICAGYLKRGHQILVSFPSLYHFCEASRICFVVGFQNEQSG